MRLSRRNGSRFWFTGRKRRLRAGLAVDAGEAGQGRVGRILRAGKKLWGESQFNKMNLTADRLHEMLRNGGGEEENKKWGHIQRFGGRNSRDSTNSSCGLEGEKYSSPSIFARTKKLFCKEKVSKGEMGKSILGVGGGDLREEKNSGSGVFSKGE